MCRASLPIGQPLNSHGRVYRSDPAHGRSARASWQRPLVLFPYGLTHRLQLLEDILLWTRRATAYLRHMDPLSVGGTAESEAAAQGGPASASSHNSMVALLLRMIAQALFESMSIECTFALRGKLVRLAIKFFTVLSNYTKYVRASALRVRDRRASAARGLSSRPAARVAECTVLQIETRVGMR